MSTLRFTAGALLLALTASVAHADLTHFYCYAPDPVGGTVYVSSMLPVGPVAERARYGQEFVEHLKKTGRVSGDVSAYCVMREGADTLARSRAALPLENRAECGGLTRFADVTWSRNGAMPQGAPLSPPIRSELHAPVVTEPATEPAPVDTGPTLVVLGNTETGKVLVVSGRPNLEKRARLQANAIRATGWQPLVSTRESGYGAVMCVQDNEETRFFYAHGKENVRDAIRAAREQAEAFAKTRGATVRVCGAPWHAGAEPLEPRDSGPVDYVKGKVREWVACDPKSTEPGRKCPPPPKADAVGTRG